MGSGVQRFGPRGPGWSGWSESECAELGAPALADAGAPGVGDDGASGMGDDGAPGMGDDGASGMGDDGAPGMGDDGRLGSVELLMPGLPRTRRRRVADEADAGADAPGGRAGYGERPDRRRAVVGVLAVVALAGSLALAGCSASVAPSEVKATYGGLPSFLPKQSLVPDSILTGTAARPALTTEGDAVRVPLGSSGTVVATVTGPQVPGEGLPYQTSATTCTWDVTLVAGREPLTIDPTDFTTIDHLGVVYHPTFVPGQPTVTTVGAGQTVTFELRTVMEVGEGLMRWAPDGKHIVASWDFEVEND